MKKLQSVEKVFTFTKLDCYQESEWEEFVTFVEENIRPRRNKQPNLHELACSDCDLPYMRLMARLGKCKPAKMSNTPLARAFHEEEDELMVS